MKHLFKLIVSQSLVLASLVFLFTSAHAQTFSFCVFESSDISGTSLLTSIHINATLTQNGDAVDILIMNDSIPGDDWVTSEVPTITKIAFDDDSDLSLPAPTFSNSPPDVIFGIDNSLNIPGSNNIGFTTTYGFIADPPPTTTGLDPGEALLVSFADTNIAALEQAMNNGDLRIAVHVQQIGSASTDYGASFVNKIPEPSSTILMGIAALIGISVRKR